MIKQIDSLVPDIQALFNGHTIDELVADKFGAGLSDLLQKRFKEYGEDKDGSLRLSSVGRPLRQLWYESRKAPKELLDAEAKVKFLYGDIIETLFILLAERAGHAVTDLQKEIEVDGVPGHIDCLIDGVLVDVKSASTFSYNKFVNGELYKDDPFGYVGQLAGYKDAIGVERAGWLVIDKTHGKFQFVPLKADYNIRERIKTVRSGLQSDSEPDFCYDEIAVGKDDKSGNRILPVGCSYCGFKFHCRRDSNDGQGLQIRFYSTGPKFFTKIVKEPRLKSTSTKPSSTYTEFPIKQEED